MPRICTVCAHAARHRIDAALVEAVPKRRVATQYRLSEASVRRHAETHLPPLLARAAGAAEVVRADDLLATARHIQTETLAVLEAAKADGNLGGVLAAVDRAQRGIALLGGLIERTGGQSHELVIRWAGE